MSDPNLDKPFLLISDTQKPYEAAKALQFCAYLKKHYRIPDENCYHAGDETDSFHGGMWEKGGDYDHTPKQEISIVKEKIKEWHSVFPEMKLCISNHGIRWVRKAAAAQIPSELLRCYKQIFGMPETWHWKDEWEIPTSHRFRITHGMGFSGKDGARNAAMDSGISTAIGHLHSHAGISYLRTGGQKIWGFNLGCLIDVDAYAFQYGKYNRMKPCLGTGVIFNKGSTPVWFPYD